MQKSIIVFMAYGPGYYTVLLQWPHSLGGKKISPNITDKYVHVYMYMTHIYMYIHVHVHVSAYTQMDRTHLFSSDRMVLIV